MNIIKKNGVIQEFDSSKMCQSISRASDDVSQPLNDSDLKHICSTVQKVIKGIRKDNTSAYEVFAIVIHVLNHEGFHDVARSYFKGREG
jgi:transcriptional repressor NrdR